MVISVSFQSSPPAVGAASSPAFSSSIASASLSELAAALAWFPRRPLAADVLDSVFRDEERDVDSVFEGVFGVRGMVNNIP
jgi:hypothetical protein